MHHEIGTLKHYSSLFRLTVIAKEYFDPLETIRILEEFLPRINLNNLRESAGTRLVFLVLFLPTKGSESNKWIQIILQIWKFVVQDSTVDQLFLGLFSGLAQDQIDSNPRDIGITKELVSWIITRGQASMGLPINSTTKSTLHQSLKQEVTSWVESRLNSLAKFLIWTLFPGNLYELGTWKYLGLRILLNYRKFITSY